MRHIFDQYSHPENRLTHALACCLAEDGKLLRAFVAWATGHKPPSGRLHIVEQRLPGEAEDAEVEPGNAGLPDIWIYTDEGWSLLIENKVASTLTRRQLERHQATAERRGFDDVRLLAIDVNEPARALPAECAFRKWSDVYVWFKRHAGRSEWARRFAEYMPVAEVRMVEDGYPLEGTLTVFDGIPFDNDHPYAYREAKRLLKLAMDELQRDPKLKKMLGVDPDADRRPAITGREGTAVWDFLPLKAAQGSTEFIKFPHPTLGVQSERLLVQLTLPNGMRREYRRRLLDLGQDGFAELLGKVNTKLCRSQKGVSGAAPMGFILQRHYRSQRSRGTIDAMLEFDLRTAFSDKRRTGEVKHQSEWLAAAYAAYKNKRSNIQLAIGATFAYGECGAIKTRRALELVRDTWLATRPVLVAMGVVPAGRVS